MATTPEGKIKALVRARLKRLGGVYSFMPVQQGLGASTLDFLGCYKGFFFAIETKKNGETPLTPRQLGCKAEMEAAGAMVFVVYDEETADQMITHLVLKERFYVRD